MRGYDFRRREQGVSASAGTNHTRCAGAVAAEVSTSKRVAAQHVLTLPLASAAVSATLYLSEQVDLIWNIDIKRTLRRGCIGYEQNKGESLMLCEHTR